ncbi:aminopyrimidine aminohydrolase [Robertmurraya siralis]|uniref:Aminopyrimidine aminohydrolase n=1 Tax=Robertmurraya siralis TaxID=77777 RepID=A0A920BTQ6_9BACI|nr:thiaminase II [Robertmurraya siralis]PAE19075.1 thiaminase II [Bacillus sp. 7504-2]GIN61866.1 aminopyrimidine aminohydrolase [Robertmurraya siralis]
MEISKASKFTERLYENVQPIWEKIHSHQFVQQLGDGTLPREKFAHYMKQDYVYLIDYAKLFAAAVTKARDLETMDKLSKVLHETLHFEMELHRQYAAEFGISREELEATKPTPINLAYTRYMLNAAQNGTLAEVVSCLLPCAWDYWEIGKLLRKQYGERITSNPYAKWIDTYDSETFAEGAKWLIKLMDELTEGLPERELALLEEHFQITSKYEYLFWDMNYYEHDWPI